MKKKKYDDDDGRQIVDMSATIRSYYSGRTDDLVPTGEKVEEQQPADLPLSREETRTFMFAALKAGLMIGLIFVAGAALLILFCIYVWFR